MSQQQLYKSESIGPILRGIEKRQRHLSAIREQVDPKDLPRLDLRVRCLEKSREALLEEAGNCKPKPGFCAHFMPKSK